MLSIRLRRMGSAKRPHYRVVVADERNWRDGRFIEILGHYDPRRDPAVVKLDVAKIEDWIRKGARPSDTVRSLVARTGRAVDVATPEPAAEPAQA
jgi:small subunit ribosomal protein S16